MKGRGRQAPKQRRKNRLQPAPLRFPRRNDAREVLLALADEFSSALRRLKRKCLRAVPRLDGSMYFELSGDGGASRLEWIGPPGEPGSLLLQGEEDANCKKAILHAASRLLSRLCERENFALVGWYNRELSCLRFDEKVTDVLLAARLEPGKSRWFSYLFEGVRQESAELVRLTFSAPAGRVALEVRPALEQFDSPQALLRNHLFYLVLVEDSRPAEKRAWLPHQVERFVGFLLSRAVHRGMRLDVAVAAGGGAEPISTSRWGNPRQWFQFFSDFEIERSNLCSFRFTDPAVWITHGEPECRFVEPDPRSEVVWWTCLPWRALPWRGPSGSLSLHTNLDERDTIMGGAEKLKRALRTATSHPQAVFVCVNNTCLPKIIGDDVSSAIEEAKKISGRPVLDLNTNLDSPDSAYEDLVRQAVEAAARDCRERRGVGLVGFPPTRGFAELRADLQKIGVEIAAVVLPDFGVRPLSAYCGVKQAIVYPQRTWLRIAENVLSRIDVPRSAPAAPYGFSRTAAWLKAVAEADGKAEAAQVWLDECLAALASEWDRLRQKAAEISVGLVVDGAETERLFSGSRLHGFEIAPLLEEFGFSLHILVRGEGGGENKILGRLANPQRHRISYFQDEPTLNRLLCQSDFRLVLTEIFFDRRITRAGKVPLHLEWLELGLQGSLRSLRRLLTAAAWPFYSRYGQYLS